jgi:hypothetical protein
MSLTLTPIIHRATDRAGRLLGADKAVLTQAQIGPANSVKQHRPAFGRPPLNIHAFGITADLKANHARSEGLV